VETLEIVTVPRLQEVMLVVIDVHCPASTAETDQIHLYLPEIAITDWLFDEVNPVS
jgi:hypothetical protein